MRYIFECPPSVSSFLALCLLVVDRRHVVMMIDGEKRSGQHMWEDNSAKMDAMQLNDQP